MIKVILFDCWGTLFTSGRIDDLHPFEKFAKLIGYSLKYREYLKSFEEEFMLHRLSELETPIRDLLRRLELQSSQETIDKLEEVLLESISTQRAYDDTLSGLNELRKDYRLVLITNSFNIAFDSLKAKYNLDNYFEKIYTSYDMHMIKPEITLFQKVIEDLNCLPEEIIMVGDSLKDDVEPAESLGMHSLLIDRTNRHPQIEDKLRDLGSIPSLLQKL